MVNLVNYYYNLFIFLASFMVAHGLLFGPAIKHLKASQGCAGGPGLCAFSSGGLEPAIIALNKHYIIL